MGRARRGFTLQAPRIAAVVLVVLLAAVAVPATRSTMATMREQRRLIAELTRLDSLETAHFTRFGFYTPNGGRIDARGFIPFTPASNPAASTKPMAFGHPRFDIYLPPIRGQRKSFAMMPEIVSGVHYGVKPHPRWLKRAAAVACCVPAGTHA